MAPRYRLGGRPTLPFGEVILFHENWTAASTERFAAFFQASIYECEAITPETVGVFPAGLARLLEGAIIATSELGTGADETQDGQDADGNDQGMLAPPENTVDLAEHRRSDLIHALHESGYTYDDIYPMLIPELDELREGSERAAQCSENGTGVGRNGSTPVQGNRGGSRANDLW